MKRIDTPTAEADKFGPGRDGFTNGDPGVPIPPTHLDASWHDHVQEELARAVESSGQELSEASLTQLARAIGETVRTLVPPTDANYVPNGLTITTSPASLTVQLAGGVYVFNGRRYVYTDDQLETAGEDEWTLPASRDNYFFVGSPDGLGSRVQVLDVANGAAAPSAPANTFQFLMVPTDGSGVPAGSPVYFNRGPALIAENLCGFQVRPPLPTAALDASLVPYPAGANVDIGGAQDNQYVRRVRCREVVLNNAASTLQAGSNHRIYMLKPTTGAGGISNNALVTASTLPDGGAAFFKVAGSAFNTVNTNGGYSFEYSFHVRNNGGTLTLDGSGGSLAGGGGENAWHRGSLAIANGVDVAATISGSIARISLTGHATNAMRWYIRVEEIICAP